MDVQTGALGHEPFDLAVSQLGVMFFDEPTAAFSAIRGLLESGGSLRLRLLAGGRAQPVAHGHGAAVLRAAAPVPPPGKSPVGPFSLGDDEYVRDILGGAGFCRCRSTESEYHRAGAGQRGGRCCVARVHGRRPRASGRGGTAASSATWSGSSSGPDEYEYPLAFRVYEAVNG